MGQNFKVINCIEPDADYFASSAEGDYVSLAEYNHATFIVQHGTGTTGTAALTINKASSATGENETAISFLYKKTSATTAMDTWSDVASATSVTTATGSSLMYMLEVDAAGLGDYYFVNLVATEDSDAPQDGGCLCILSEPRFAGDDKRSALA